MNSVHQCAFAVYLCLLFALRAPGQNQQPTSTRSTDAPATVSSPADSGSPESAAATGGQAVVPRLMKFSGVLHDASGKPLTGTVDVTFALYRAEARGDALWFETQSVQADELGRYTALLGAMHPDGLPVDLFTSGEVRWLGIQVGSQAEQQPRVLLVSVPYALKAGDAETLGGKPASAFMLADTQKGTSSATSVALAPVGAPLGGVGLANQQAPTAAAPLTACTSVTSDGAAAVNSIALFTTACNIESANLVQYNGNLGFGIALPQARLHIFGPTISDSDAHFNFILGDSTPAATGVGGGIQFSGYYNGTTNKAGFANIRGVKENAAQGDYASALIFDTRASGGNQTERMRITSAGRVGIGTTAPNATLQVVGVNSTDGDARFNMISSDNTPAAAGVGGGITFTGFYNATNRASYANIRGVKENTTVGDYASALIFDTRVNGGVQTERMRISSGGNVGIGTSAPAAKLDVAGDINSSGTVAAAFFSGDASNLFNIPSASGLNCSGCVGNFQLGINYAASDAQSGDAMNALALGGMPAVDFPMTTSTNTFVQSQNVTTGAGTAFLATTNDPNTAAAVFSNADANGDVIEVFPPGGIVAPISNSSGFAPVTHKPGTPIMRVTAALDVITSGNLQGSNFNVNSTNFFAGTSTGNSTMTGTANVGLGYQILQANTTGASNTATGFYSLTSNTQGLYNAAGGFDSLYYNTSGSANTAMGGFALEDNSDANGSTAFGYGALYLNCSGIASGCLATHNTAVGDFAGVTATQANANISGSGNTFIGYNSGPGTSTPINNATAIGENALVSASNALVLGGTGGDAVNVGIGTPTPAVTLQVVGDIRVGTSGTNGCVQNFAGSPLSGSCSSDARLKTDIQPFPTLLDKVSQLQPVHYHWRVSEFPQYHFGSALITGLVAQEVEKIFPEMVSVDSRGYKTVNYSELPFLLLESVRELKAENDDLRAQIKVQEERSRSQQGAEVAQLKREVEELRALVTKSAAQGKSADAQAGQ